MSAPLGQAILVGPEREHTLSSAKMGTLRTETDLRVFRAPFGKRWHKAGTGRAEPETIPLQGTLRELDREAAKAKMRELLQDLPRLSLLKIGIWEIPIKGATGRVTITPTLTGYTVSLHLTRSDA